jgi:hypothetical protein
MSFDWVTDLQQLLNIWDFFFMRSININQTARKVNYTALFHSTLYSHILVVGRSDGEGAFNAEH